MLSRMTHKVLFIHIRPLGNLMWLCWGNCLLGPSCHITRRLWSIWSLSLSYHKWSLMLLDNLEICIKWIVDFFFQWAGDWLKRECQWWHQWPWLVLPRLGQLRAGCYGCNFWSMWPTFLQPGIRKPRFRLIRVSKAVVTMYCRQITKKENKPTLTGWNRLASIYNYNKSPKAMECEIG